MSNMLPNDRRIISGVSSEMLCVAVEIAKKQHPYDKELNHVNPYTKELITDEASYLRYLREHCYYDFCDHRITAERASAMRASKEELKKHRKRFVILCFVFMLALIITFIVSSNKIDRAFEDGRTAGYDKGYEVGSSEGYKSGYDEGKSDGYDSGYRSGYSDGKTVGNCVSSSSRSYSNTGTGSTRAAPIADCYIGNRDTRKYHLPTCSYLPDQDNQVLFDSAEEAESYGYEPCGKCNPN